MITLFCSIVLLVLAFLVYGKVIDKIFGVDPSRPTPAIKNPDGVDYVPLNTPKNFLIQFLNIAGLGPIFGPIMGALYGPAAFIWIIVGAIFAGGVHDYFSGMMSVRTNGKTIAEITGNYLGEPSRYAMLFVSVMLLLFVGIVFVVGPAALLANLTFDATPGAKGVFHGTIFNSKTFWVFVIFGYYFVSTIVPIDKIIGRIYPFFIFTVSCGAISGFHATQSPLVARTLMSEGKGRVVFYGAMLTESFIAMIWAGVGMAFFPEGIAGLNSTLAAGGPGLVVNKVAVGYLGIAGGLLAILGVIVAPITSGDTAFRSIRLSIADRFNFSQVKFQSRLYIAVPIFVVAFFITKLDFSSIWRYFSFFNQLLATFVLWTAVAYLRKHGKNIWLVGVPVIFMSACLVGYILTGKEFPFELSHTVAVYSGLAGGLAAFAVLVCLSLKKPAQVIESDKTGMSPIEKESDKIVL